jgi:pre-mRNA-processing factor 40
VYPLFKDDNRYLDMLGNPGSNPLELFWDAVDTLDQQLDAKVGVVEDVIKRHNATLESVAAKKDGEGDGKKDDDDAMDVTPILFAVTPTTTWDEFAAVVNKEADSSLKALSDVELHLVFDTVGLSILCICASTNCISVLFWTSAS